MRNRYHSVLCLLFVLAVFSCTNDNTDTSVNQNSNPVAISGVIDSFPPQLDTLMFNKVALDCFFELGSQTGGEFYYKSATQSVHNVINEVLRDHARSGSDIVLLIDKTGSMQNDIDSVKINMGLIIEQIEKIPNVQVAISVYGDKNVDGPEWWSTSDLTTDLDLAKNYLDDISVSEGGDYPESVYDGIAMVVENLNWRSTSKKLILVVGDAPSLEDSLTDHSRKDVIDLCATKGINANLFPILVTPYKTEDFLFKTEFSPTYISKIYPNPASEIINLELLESSEYLVSLISLDGVIVFETITRDTALSIDVPENVSSGTYILRVLDKTTYMSESEKIVIQ